MHEYPCSDGHRNDLYKSCRRDVHHLPCDKCRKRDDGQNHPFDRCQKDDGLNLLHDRCQRDDGRGDLRDRQRDDERDDRQDRDD